jgi:hypothetical protein
MEDKNSFTFLLSLFVDPELERLKLYPEIPIRQFKMHRIRIRIRVLA